MPFASVNCMFSISISPIIAPPYKKVTKNSIKVSAKSFFKLAGLKAIIVIKTATNGFTIKFIICGKKGLKTAIMVPINAPKKILNFVVLMLAIFLQLSKIKLSIIKLSTITYSI